MEKKGSRKKTSKKGKTEVVDFKKLFKFQSFTKRIEGIQINVTQRTGGHLSDTPGGHETFFSEALHKWKELNCTHDFVGFQREVQNKTSILPQQLYHKDHVLSKLKQCLSVKDTLAYEPLLDLLVQLARDLQDEFYPNFKEFFPILVALCDTQNTEIIQCVFTTFAYLFKFLWRHMLKDLDNVFRLYSELLHQSQKPYIRQFAAESFGFLLRKVGDRDPLFDLIFQSVSDDPDLCEGVGCLLFEMLRGVAKQFHSICKSSLSLLLKTLGSLRFRCEHVFQALTKMMELMAEHTRKDLAKPVWTPLLDHLALLHGRWTECRGENEGDGSSEVPLHVQLGHTLHLIGIMVSWRKGSRIGDKAKLFQVVQQLLKDSSLHLNTLNVALHLAASLVLVSEDLPEWQVSIVECVCGRESSDQEEVKLIMTFFQEISQCSDMFIKSFFPSSVLFCESVLKKKENHLLVLQFLTEICLFCDPRTVNDSCVSATPSSTFTLDLSPLEVKRKVAEGRTLRSSSRLRSAHQSDLSILSLLGDELESGLERVREAVCEGNQRKALSEEEEKDMMKRMWCALVCCQYVRPIPEKILNLFKELYLALKAMVSSKKREEDKDVCLFVFSQTLSTIVSVLSSNGQELTAAIPIDDVICLLKLYSTSVPLLISSYHYFSVLSSSNMGDSALLSCARLQNLLPCLQSNLSSPTSPVRLLTLRILCLFDQLPLELPVANDNHELQEDSYPVTDLLEVCLRAEEIPPSLDSYRDKVLWMEKLKYSPSHFNVLPATYKEIPLRYLVGVLYINFNLLWKPTINVISSYAVEENKQLFWGVMEEMLNQISNILENENHKSLDELSTNSCEESETHTWHKSIAVLFQYQNQLISGMECRRPDHANHRILLWKCLSELNLEITEPRSRILVPLLFKFIRNEYSLREESLMVLQDLRKPADGDATITLTHDVETAMVEDLVDSAQNLEDIDCEEEKGKKVGAPSLSGRKIGTEKGKTKKKASGQDVHGSAGKNLTATLLSMLRVFSKFRNPKSFYKQEELWQLYMKLLIHKQSEVQALALACLMGFKPPYLLPYRENFDRLLEDTSFREELINFNIT